MMINEQWFKDHFNKFYDVDGVYGSQCVDLFKQVLKEMGCPNYAAAIGGDGWAHSIWYNRSWWGKYFTPISKGQVKYGDIIVFEKGGETPYSHVGICAGYTSNGRIICFGQNQGGLKRAGDIGSACNYTNLSISTLLGGLRPIIQNACVRWNSNAYLVPGDIVSSKTLGITEINTKNGHVYVPKLGGWVPACDLDESDLTKDGKYDQIIANTNSKVWLKETMVELINQKTNQVKVNGYWVDAEPLCRKEYVEDV